MMQFLKNITPKSIFAKLILILILPIIISQSVIIYIFIFNKSRYNENRMAIEVVNQINFIKDNIENQNLYSQIETVTSIKFFPEKNQKNIAKSILNNNNRVIKNFIKILQDSAINIVQISYLEQNNLIKMIITHNRKYIFLQFDERKIFNARNDTFIYWILLITLIMSAIIIIFTKNQIRSIKNLANLADNLYIKEDKIKNFSPSGPSEIKQLGKSFLQMTDRINKDIEEKRNFLSAISHDLRTPLARIKLSVEMIQECEDIQGIKSDIVDMEQMINQYLNYCASGDNIAIEELFLYEISDLLKNRYNKKNINITSNIKKEKIMGNLVNINRMIANLVNNSLKYGKNINIFLKSNKKNFIFIIEDDGIGIAKNEIPEITKPFYRLDNSRNLDNKNIGLGLAIVKNIVNEHSGSISFDKSQEIGGLKVEIKFPLKK